MIVFVFSYNRGDFLLNCIKSIERSAPEFEIRVYDDKSDDPGTIEALEEIEKRHSIFVSDVDQKGKCGGLYGNMQAAFDSLGGDELFCFLQDDMQMVRDVTSSDVSYIEDYFSRNPRSGFLQPCFMKGRNREKDMHCMRFDPESEAYFRQPSGHKAGVFFAATFVSKADRLRESGWCFAESEEGSEGEARKHFTEMGFMFSPFAAWLPNVPAYRRKKKTVAARLAEKRNRCALYPFRHMSADDVDKLRRRSSSVLPVAEDFLQTEGATLEKPWIYSPLQNQKFLRRLNRAENQLRAICPSLAR